MKPGMESTDESGTDDLNHRLVILEETGIRGCSGGKETHSTVTNGMLGFFIASGPRAR